MPKRQFLKTMEDSLRYNPLFSPFSMFEYNLDLVWNGSRDEWISKGWSTILGMFTFIVLLFFGYNRFYDNTSELLLLFLYVFLITYVVISILSLLFKKGWQFLEHFIKFVSGIQFSLIFFTALIALGLVQLYVSAMNKSGG